MTRPIPTRPLTIGPHFPTVEGGARRAASSRNGRHPGWEYGIRIGNLRDGSVVAFIDGSNPEGVAVTRDGTVYAAVVAYGGALLKNVKKPID